MFRILIFYKDDAALDNYLNLFRFLNSGSGHMEKRIMYNRREYIGSFFHVVCCRGLSENARGYKAHFIAIQEDLTWKENWPGIRDYILRPMIASPIPIHVFSSMSYDEAAAHEEARQVT